MLSLLSAVFQFAIQAADPSWSCELTHRESYVAGTFYLYCSQMTADGIEIVSVGKFIADAQRGEGRGLGRISPPRSGTTCSHMSAETSL